jgi:ribosomal protein S18 acetylase RimI-like enzyme
MLVDYAAVMNDNGKYTPYSAKIYDVVPIGMHLSKDGHFLVTTISVGRMFDKLNKWSERMPARLSPWNGSKEAFFKEFTEKYLQNWQNGLAGETGLAGTPEEALAKKNIFNDFLNLTTKDTAPLNPDRTKTPRRRGDVRGKDIDRTIMSMRLDHMAELIDNEGAPKVPVDYGKAIKNFMPAEMPAEQPISREEERKPSAIDLGITAARTPESRPFVAQYVAPQAQAPTPKSDLFFMPASAEIREEGSKQHLEFWNRELENSGIKEKPTTMEALEKFIYKQTGKTYASENLLYQGRLGESVPKLFPTPNAEKIKAYYSNVVRNATPEQAINFPENWRRVRNMSDEEFNNFFSQDRVEKITKSRVETLSKSADYLLGEMQEPEIKKYITENEPKIKDLQEKLKITTDQKQRDEIYYSIDFYEKQIEKAKRQLGSYTPAEVAAILDASAKVRVRTGKDENGNMIPVKQKITNGNEVVPNEVSGATASRIAEYMRQGMGSEEAYTKGVFDTMKARAEQRGTYTGWKKYDQSDDMGEAEKLNADVSGTNWCTGGAVSTAHGHLSGGDFYVYFDEGEPQVAIRTDDGQIAEVRGRGDGQNITTPAYDQAAEEFIRSGEGPEGGDKYLHDREFRKLAVEIIKTGKIPEAAMKYYDQYGNFSAPTPKMSYRNKFEPEYLEAFESTRDFEEPVFDEKTGTLKTNLTYDPDDSSNDKYIHINGGINLPKSYSDDDFSPKGLKNLKSIDGEIRWHEVQSPVIFPALERASHIDVGKAVEVEFPSLVESGSIDAYDARSFIAPELKKSLHITYRPSGYSKQDLVFEVPKLEESGDIFTRHLDTLNLPSLKKASAINGEFARNLIAPKLVSCDRLDLVNMSYIPKFERTQKTYLFGGKYVYEIVAKPDILESVLRVNDGQCYTTDSDSGKHYFTENVSQARELSEAFNEIYWKKQNNLTIEEAKTILDKYEIKPLMPVEGDRGLRIISAKVRFGQNASTEFASNHIDAMSQIFGDKYDKNYNTRRSRENDSFGYEVSSPNGNFMVDRRTAYSIAKENGQLREPETLDQKVDYDRGVLHSDMVNYEGEKSGISFMPKSEEEQPEQKISSAGTSLRQVPAVFKAIPWKKGTLNADLGGGKYDEFTNALQTQGVENVIYDPYNRSAEHNQAAMDRIAGNADTATISNVLNVIAEPAARDQVIRQAADAIKPEGEAYFSVYIGDGSGKGKETPRGYQLNRKLADYIEEIERHFGSVTKKGNILIAKEPVKSGASDISFMPSAGESQKVPTQEELDAMKERLPAYKSELEQHAEGRFTIHLYNEDNSKYVGIAEGQIRGNEPNKVYIYDSEVKPQFKKQGYGEALYRELAKYAQDNGATTLWGNPASEEAVAVRNKLFKTSTGIQNTAIGGYGYASSKVPRDISFMPAAGESQKVPTQEELDAMKARLPKYKVKNKSYDENSTPDDEFYGEGYDEIYIYSPDEKYLIGKAVVENNGYGVVSVINTEVMKGYRGKGFGEALYREMAKYAQSVGANTLYGYPISESAMKVRKKLFDTDESTSKVPSDISFMPADEEYTNEQKTRNDLVRKYDDLIKSQSSKGSSVVYHQPPEKDANGDVISNELWVVSSPKNERESIITKNDDGLFDVSKGEDGMFYDHKTLEDAMIQARHYVESAPSSDQNNLQRDARSEIMEEIHIPSDMVLKEVRDTANDSIYYRVDHILSRDEEGNPDDVETYKISIRNHDPSPFRELEFGKNDYWVEVPKNPSPKDMADAVSKVEKWLENQSDISFMPASKLDEAHAKAIESGDTEEAQRLIDEAARKAGYTIGPVWHHGGFDKDVHGIPNTEKGMHFGTKEAATQRAYQKGHDDQIESLKVEQDPETGKWHWSTTDYDSWDSNEEGFNTESQARRDADDAMDAMYSSDSWLDVQPEDLGTFTKAYLKGNFKKIADVGSGWADEIEKAKKQGYDGFVYKNDVEDIGSTSYSIFNPEQAKSADPATYDEQGNLIPLSQRFDTSKRDIRFMPKSEEKSLSRDYSEYETDEDYERPKADEFLSAKTIASINKVISKIEKTLPAHSITEKTTKKGYSVLSITPEGAKKPIGTALVGLENNEVQLEDIEVDDDYRGKRYGRALMLGAVKWGLEKGATRMYADNVVSNTEPPWMGIFGSWRMESVDEGAGAWADFTEIPKNLVSKKSGDISFIPYSPELPKDEDGKVDWEGFKTRTDEISKPLAGLSFSPSGKEQDYDFMHEAGVALPKKVPARGYFNIGVSTPDGRVLVYKLDPKRAVMPQIKGLDTISGEYVHILQADRHDTTGDNMGGPMHPYLISNQVTAVGPDGIEYKPVWANMTAGLVTRAKNRVMETQNGYALVYAMDENAHKSNRKLVGDYMKEVDDLIKANGLTAEQIEATHVLLELGKWQDDRTEAQLKYRKAVEKAEANKTKPPKPLKDTPTDKAIMRLNADLSPLKSHMTSGNPDRISKAQTEIVKILKKHSQQDWYKDLAKKTAGLTFANEMKSFSFTARALAMDKIAGVPFLPSLHKLLRATEDFKNAQNSDVVGVVQLSKNRDVFAIYLGNDPKQEAKMSKSERAIRDQFLKDPNFRIHPSYDWMMLGPANGNNFIVASPKKLRDIFPDYENQHSKLKLKPKHKITDALVAGSMNLSAEPKIQIP